MGKKSFQAPSPHFIKQSVLLRESLSDSTWVESGTYLGETTKVLANRANKVYSIEPGYSLYNRALKLLDKYPNVEIINGLSEEVLPKILPKIEGNVNFWLDGHYSAGSTFQGPQDCPVLDELYHIGVYLEKYINVVIFIDDFRCFDPRNPHYSTYPKRIDLINWCEKNFMDWYVEHDILIIKKL